MQTACDLQTGPSDHHGSVMPFTGHLRSLAVRGSCSLPHGTCEAQQDSGNGVASKASSPSQLGGREVNED